MHFIVIHCFIERYLLGKGELAPCHRPAFPAEAAAVITAPLAEAAIRTWMFLRLRLILPACVVLARHQ